MKFGPKTSAALFLLLSCTLDRIGVNPAVGREDMEDVWESDELRILSRMMGLDPLKPILYRNLHRVGCVYESRVYRRRFGFCGI